MVHVITGTLVTSYSHYLTPPPTPPCPPPRCIHRTHRLLAIQSTTPEELYERKIRLEEYREAISLARAYGLDCDTVYQQQWERAPTSVASIRNYLVRSKCEWVNSCEGIFISCNLC